MVSKRGVVSYVGIYSRSVFVCLGGTDADPGMGPGDQAARVDCSGVGYEATKGHACRKLILKVDELKINRVWILNG